MGYKLTNNATSTLAGSITDVATSLSVQTGDASKFPTLGGSDWTYATLVDASGNVEVVKVTARSGANLTVVRGQDGTTALAWDAGDRIDVRLNVQALADLTEPGARVHDGTAATTMADADELGFWQNAATAWRKITWANFATAVWTKLGALIAAGTGKTTPVDGDTLPLSDSAATNATKKLTWANLKDGIFTAWGALINGGTSKTTPVDNDALALMDSAATNATKKLLLSNLRAWLLSTVMTLNGGPLGGSRNKIINGDFDFWQRATSQTATGYGSDDRWANVFVGGSMTHSRQTFTLGQTDVPGNPEYFSRTVVTHAAAAGNLHAKIQKIEDVRSLAGKTVTVTFWAKADAAKNIAVELYQDFGTGGSPSAAVSTPAGLKALTTSWQKFSFTVAAPSISGKTLGSNANDSLQLYFWFEAGSTYTARSSSIGQQSGTFDIAHVSVVEGDATGETDPFSPRHLQQELALCQRYYETGRSRWCGSVQVGYSYFTEGQFRVNKRAPPSVTLTLLDSSYFPGSAGTASSILVSSFAHSKTANGNDPRGYFGDDWAADAEL